MSEQLISSGTIEDSIAGAALIGLWSHSEVGVVIGAFAGSVLFIVSASDLLSRTKIALFLVSWIAGILSADFCASIINYITPEGIAAQRPLGALVSSAIVVRLLIFLGGIAKNPTSIIEKYKKGPHE